MAYDINEITNFIVQAAQARGIDPNIAVKVARSEGLAPGVWQSNVTSGRGREPSYGPFQLLVGGPGTGFPAGMGNDFINATGLDPRDPANVKATIEFALDRAASVGWSPWYGAAKVGVDRYDGLRAARPRGVNSGGGSRYSAMAYAPQGSQAGSGGQAAISNMASGGGRPAPARGGGRNVPTYSDNLTEMLQRGMAKSAYISGGKEYFIDSKGMHRIHGPAVQQQTGAIRGDVNSPVVGVKATPYADPRKQPGADKPPAQAGAPVDAPANGSDQYDWGGTPDEKAAAKGSDQYDWSTGGKAPPPAAAAAAPAEEPSMFDAALKGLRDGFNEVVSGAPSSPSDQAAPAEAAAGSDDGGILAALSDMFGNQQPAALPTRNPHAGMTIPQRPEPAAVAPTPNPHEGMTIPQRPTPAPTQSPHPDRPIGLPRADRMVVGAQPEGMIPAPFEGPAPVPGVPSWPGAQPGGDAMRFAQSGAPQPPSGIGMSPNPFPAPDTTGELANYLGMVEQGRRMPNPGPMRAPGMGDQPNNMRAVNTAPAPAQMVSNIPPMGDQPNNMRPLGGPTRAAGPVQGPMPQPQPIRQVTFGEDMQNLLGLFGFGRE